MNECYGRHSVFPSSVSQIGFCSEYIQSGIQRMCARTGRFITCIQFLIEVIWFNVPFSFKIRQSQGTCHNLDKTKNIDTIEYRKFASSNIMFSDMFLLQMTIFYLETLVYTRNVMVNKKKINDMVFPYL